MQSGKIKVNSENIFPVIKKWLYSEQDIFIRELIANACDAITKYKKLAALGETEDCDGKITVTVSKKNKTVTFADNGIGMTADEVDKYINQIAFSGAEDFLAKYSGADAGGIIGHFGLGFYSAFIVADKVEINSLSYLAGAEPAKWVCDGSVDYTLDKGTAGERGTAVTLHIGTDGKKYLEYATVLDILKKYCAYLPYTITLIDADRKDKSEVINETPIFVRLAKDVTEEEYKDFYQKNFADFRAPLFYIHINVDYPFTVKGVLYFPELGNIPAQNEGLIKVYNNQVFVTDNVKELVPEYLGVLKGMLDCADMPLNVSRSSLQNTEYWKKVRAHIVKKTAEKLRALCKDFEAYCKIWDKANSFLKFGCVMDEDFYKKIKDVIVLKTADGEYKKLVDILAGVNKTIYYTNTLNGMGAYLSGYKAAGEAVYLLNEAIDTHFISFLEHTESGVKFARIDSSAEAFKTAEEGEGGDKIIEAFRKVAGGSKTVEAQAVNSEMPCLILSGEQSVRMQTMGRLMGMPEMPAEEKVLINLSSSIIKRQLDNPDENVIKYCYDLARLASGSLPASDVNGFIENAVKVLGVE